jgi:hypothetical protein
MGNVNRYSGFIAECEVLDEPGAGSLLFPFEEIFACKRFMS